MTLLLNCPVCHDGFWSHREPVCQPCRFSDGVADIEQQVQRWLVNEARIYMVHNPDALTIQGQSSTLAGPSRRSA